MGVRFWLYVKCTGNTVVVVLAERNCRALGIYTYIYGAIRGYTCIYRVVPFIYLERCGVFNITGK